MSGKHYWQLSHKLLFASLIVDYFSLKLHAARLYMLTNIVVIQDNSVIATPTK